jgi:hypothetical protein
MRMRVPMSNAMWNPWPSARRSRCGQHARSVDLFALCVVALFAISSCKYPNPDYCPESTDNRCPAINAPDTPDPDLGVSDCAPEQCTDSSVCLPDGACADVAMVAYVADDGTGTMCTKDAPCGTRAQGIATSRPYVKVSGTVSEPAPLKITRDVTILGGTTAELMPTTGTKNNDLIVIDDDRIEIHQLGISGVGASGNEFEPLAAISVEGVEALVTLVGVRIHGNMESGVALRGGAEHTSLTIIEGSINDNGIGIWAEGCALSDQECDDLHFDPPNKKMI